MVLDHVILIYVPKMLNERIYRYTLRLTNIYYEGATLYGNKLKKKAQNPPDCIKILIIITPPIQTLLVAILFRTIHQKYQFMKRNHLRILGRNCKQHMGMCNVNIRWKNWPSFSSTTINHKSYICWPRWKFHKCMSIAF